MPSTTGLIGKKNERCCSICVQSEREVREQALGTQRGEFELNGWFSVCVCRLVRAPAGMLPCAYLLSVFALVYACSFAYSEYERKEIWS